ncbi:FAD-binding oxidoreductase [Sphingomonas sp. Leaf20]|uniref:FAD-binding oxidoreductase n=1 Tax=Sphingomonas sp. Leaf20 TaxID=1735685 RepID=UPI001F421C65|nr:FAD-binding oxidoreductase [Sphingomonas sp. Leaf20]
MRDIADDPGMMMTLMHDLIAAIGKDAVSDDPAARAVMSNDVYRGAGVPALIVRPTTVEALQAAVRVCAAAGVAMVPRGGGASYTDGYLVDTGGHVLFDTGALDSIEVDADNAVVTVGAGTTWAKLKDALTVHGLRTPFWGPFSGLVATVGGGISQNTLSHGSGAYGISAQSVLSLDVVLASGELLRTGTSQATRYYGPDLTGLFTGDCGALGIKATIRLPLIAIRPHSEAVSFAFDSFAACHAGVSKAQREGLDDSHFGLDLALSQGQIARQDGVGAKLKIARELFAKAPNAFVGVKQLIRMALAGDTAMQAGAYMCHFIIEGVDATDAVARATKLRAAIAPYGREIANTVPSFVRSLPFAPLTNILGPSGERWVPIHGVLQQDKVVPFHDALRTLYETRKTEMDRLGIWSGTMFSPAGSSGFLYEVALYWPDDRTDYHRHTLTSDHVASLKPYAENAEARAYTHELKAAVIALYQQFGAAHFQIGRAYPYRDRLDPQALALLLGIKAALDPKGLMNPGALGL